MVVIGEGFRGGGHAALLFDEDTVRAVDHDLADFGITHELFDRTEAENLVEQKSARFGDDVNSAQERRRIAFHRILDAFFDATSQFGITQGVPLFHFGNDDPAKLTLRANVPEAERAQARKLLAGYYAHCTALDDCFGELRRTLRETGLEETTLLV
ncbi:MAG TPA: hypothetical protein PKO06_23155, partial [Candidatus Ozemobacteraceae bacterium]|nr:hypothetical protein [Candidatus Ozemobacteraceae bacterium]